MDDAEWMAPETVVKNVCEMLGVEPARAKLEIARKGAAGKLEAQGSLPNCEWRPIPPQVWEDGLDTWMTYGTALPGFVWILFRTRSVLQCFSLAGAASSRDGEGAAAAVAEPPPPTSKGHGGAKERFPWDDYWGELVCMVHEGEIAKGDAETAQRLEARLQRKGHTKLPSSEYLEARVRRVLVSFRAKNYAPD